MPMATDLKTNKLVNHGKLEDQHPGDGVNVPLLHQPMHSNQVEQLAEEGRRGVLERVLNQVEATATADRNMIAQLFTHGKPGTYNAKATLLPKTERQRLNDWHK